jgi:hypothetical protein
MRRPVPPAAVTLEHLLSEKLRLEATLPTLESELREREKELRREELDVDCAEGEGLVAFLERLCGEKKALLARERAEAAAARLKRDKSRSALDSARSRLVDLRLKLERTQAAQQRVAGLLELSSGAKAAHALQLELCQIEEAQAAVARALRYLDWMDESLRSAEKWGVFDMFGGGAIAAGVKHSRLDQAHERMAGLQTALRSIEKELGDIGARGPESPQLDGFTRFADCFLDGYFVDWMVQKRITNSIESLRTLRMRLTQLRGDLSTRERRASEELALLPPR